MVPAVKRPRSRKCLTSAEAWERLERVAHRLRTTGRLGTRDSKQASAAFSLLNHPSESTSHDKYRQFLDLVLQNCGPQAVRLCAVALGQNNVRDMKMAHRRELISKLGEEQHRTLINQSFPNLQGDTEAAALLKDNHSSGSENLRISPTSEGVISENGGVDIASASTYRMNLEPELFHDDGIHGQTLIYHHRERLSFEDPTEHIPSCRGYRDLTKPHAQDDSQENSDITNTQEIFEHASIDGIAAVFKGLICGAIRTTSVHVNGITRSTASVTTVFPPWGAVDCLLSLDIWETSVEPLAMALFNATVKWVKESLHIGFTRGTSLTIPNSEVTLKGVHDEAIVQVFGSEIQQAINQSSIRIQEMEKGKLMTECVSMIITEKGAIISLSLGLVQGLEIRKKLYT
ncbi:hypothetical protein ASPZODRAFT_137517 [Penicilliopsis zonata CBS 506.65]|uniref:Uncharacterized protein n=1 Tax=Penicilliopsis zonata CBS 506.65 TaxID=1073090 RepID=A0A1L9S4G3_9EURO|nr:hypothetical protein ASPZODRAFT_137517 [Penicilliopsis zonata CBS 506.65]OJJ42058.1 hypothetical protein ASPZODRAFT_137517 [Penicilliopsis zonata CBS 506.65]